MYICTSCIFICHSHRFRSGWLTKGLHDTIWVLFSHLRDQQGTHAGAGASSQGVAELKALPQRDFEAHRRESDEIAMNNPKARCFSPSCKQSQPSASFRTTSNTLSINSAPSV